jgi:hypothetical protein
MYRNILNYYSEHSLTVHLCSPLRGAYFYNKDRRQSMDVWMQVQQLRLVLYRNEHFMLLKCQTSLLPSKFQYYLVIKGSINNIYIFTY